MAEIYLVHWNETEAAEQARALRSAGHRVRVHWSTQAAARIDPLPDVLVVSLDRLPSHGRAVAEWMGEARRRQHVPIVFVGGANEKVQAARARFPKATFCGSEEVVRAVGENIEQPSPTRPTPTPHTRARPRP